MQTYTIIEKERDASHLHHRETSATDLSIPTNATLHNTYVLAHHFMHHDTDSKVYDKAITVYSSVQKDCKNDEANEMYTDIAARDFVHHDCIDSKSDEKHIPFYSSVHHDRNESNVDEMYVSVSDIVNHDSNEGEDMYSSINLQ